MEAPEKIYIHEASAPNLTDKLPYHLEYIRKDAFIEKAEVFIYAALNDGIIGSANIEAFMRLFKKYMKGE